jgi:uncharacterized phiE125 gp8 family phage protein
MNSIVIEAGALPVSLSEAKAWLRLGPATEDGMVSALILSAANLCEVMTGRMLIVREVSEEVPVRDGWLRLSRGPVRAVTDVTLKPESGLPVLLTREQWQLRADSDGEAAVRVADTGDALSVVVRYRAGLAADAAAVPDALKQGMLRMIQHLYAARDGGEDAAVPSIVAALWTPWRRVML